MLPDVGVLKFHNRTRDDPLLLYAALYSGMGTKFLSKDLMRGHAYLLKNQSLRSTFRRWQLLHQCQLRYVSETGKVLLKVAGKILLTKLITFRHKYWYMTYILTVIESGIRILLLTFWRRILFQILAHSVFKM